MDKDSRTGCGAHSGVRARFNCLSCAQADLKVWRTKYQLAFDENVKLISQVAKLKNDLASVLTDIGGRTHDADCHVECDCVDYVAYLARAALAGGAK